MLAFERDGCEQEKMPEIGSLMPSALGTGIMLSDIFLFYFVYNYELGYLNKHVLRSPRGASNAFNNQGIKLVEFPPTFSKFYQSPVTSLWSTLCRLYFPGAPPMSASGTTGILCLAP